MNKLHVRALIRYLLCTVFLAVQGVHAHAHLNTFHAHEGVQHEHLGTMHVHYPEALHLDAFDRAPADHGGDHATGVVDLAQAVCPPGYRFLDHAPGASAATPAIAFTLVQDLSVPAISSPLTQRPPPHTGEPRAPPVRS